MKVAKGIVSSLVVGFFFLWYELTLPTLSLAYFDGFLFIGFAAVALVALICWWTSDEDEFRGKPVVVSAIVLIVLCIIGGIAGSALFNSSAMYSQIGKIEDKDFMTDVVEVDTSQIPVVDLELAAKLADKKIG